MIFVQERKRRKYLNTESISSDLGNIFLDFYIQRKQKVLTSLDNIVCQEINSFTNKARNLSASMDCFVNDTINNTLDYVFYGATEEVDYEEAKDDVKKNEVKQITSSLVEDKEGVDTMSQILSGKFINSYSLKDKKPRKLWKWADRMKYLEGVFREKKFFQYDEVLRMNVQHLINKNSYLKRKHKDIYDKINSYFSY